MAIACSAQERVSNTVNMALSECSSIANEFERDQSTPSKEQRAKKRLALSERSHLVKRKCGDGVTFAKCHVDCIQFQGR